MRGKDKRQDWVYVGVATVCRRLFKSNPTLLFIEFMPFYELSKWKMFHAKRPVTRRLTSSSKSYTGIDLLICL